MSHCDASPDVICLDHNATTPLAPEALEAMLPYLRAQFGTPSSDHVLGHRARRAIEEGRDQVASLIGARTQEIVFTSGGTESNILAIRSIATSRSPGRRRIVTSQVEHPATAAPCDLLEHAGWTGTRVAASGAIMAIPALADAARGAGIFVHRDAAPARNAAYAPEPRTSPASSASVSLASWHSPVSPLRKTGYEDCATSCGEFSWRRYPGRSGTL